MIIKKHIKLINNPARERITYELMKLFEGAYTVKALLNMDKDKLLYEILPIFLDVRKVPPNTHHHLDLLHHSIETVNQIQNFYNIAKPEVKEHLDSVYEKYTNKVKRDVEGFVINYKNIISKYPVRALQVRLSFGIIYTSELLRYECE